MRRFEFEEGSSRKFWQIAIEGSSLRIGWGRIDTAGQEQTKSFANAAAAQKALDALVNEKVKKGYVERGAKGTKASPKVAAKADTKGAGAKKAAAKPAKAATKPAKVAAKPAKAAAAKPAKAAPKTDAPKASKGAGKAVWRPRFEAMVADLRAKKSIEVSVAKIKAPATDAEIAAATKSFGRPIPAEIVAFYRELNGFELEWTGPYADDRGCVNLVPIQEVFGEWPSIWFEGFEDLIVFDFFVAEALAALRPDKSEKGAPLEVVYHYCGEEVEPTGYGFTAYLERLLESRGYWYWLHSLTTAKGDSRAASNFLERAPKLFPKFARGLFKPAPKLVAAAAAKDAGMSLDDDDFDEAVVARAAAKKGDAEIARIAAIVDDADPKRRRRALQVLMELGKRAFPHAARVLRCADTTGALESTLSLIVPKAERKRFYEKELAKSSDIRLLSIANAADLLEGISSAEKQRIEALATKAIDSEDIALREDAGRLLEFAQASAKTFTSLTGELGKASGGRLAAIVRAIGALELYSQDEAVRKKQATITTKHVEHADDAVKAAAIGNLGRLGLADKEWSRLLKATSSKAENVRTAALYSIGQGDKHVRHANALLYTIENDAREKPAIRSLAARARDRWRTLPLDLSVLK